jgi:uncharacterized membrane protein
VIIFKFLVWQVYLLGLLAVVIFYTISRKENFQGFLRRLRFHVVANVVLLVILEVLIRFINNVIALYW